MALLPMPDADDPVNRGRWCPIVWWALAYSLSFPTGDLLIRLAGEEDQFFPYAVVVSVGAAVFGAAALEVALRPGASCSIDLWSKRSRAALFVGAAAAGLFVVYPGTTLTADVDLTFRILAAFGIACIAVIVAHHIELEHRRPRRQALLSILGGLVRAPLWVLSGMIIVLMLTGIGEIIYTLGSSEEANDSSSTKRAVDAAGILGEVGTRGARVLVRELYDQPDRWDELLQCVERGDEAWIRVAVALRPGTDAGSSSMLGDAVAVALASKPANVLRLAVPEFTLDRVCGGRQDPLATYELAAAELDKMVGAVAAVQAPDLSTRRQDCLYALEASRAHLKRFFGEE